jgi:hypothetical protein
MAKGQRVEKSVTPESSKVPVLTDFVVGKTSFKSTGFSRIKITEGGVVKHLDIPIQSVGIMEMRKELEKKEPTPPHKLRFVKANSSDGKALGLKEDETVSLLDFTDETYLEAYAEYRRDLVWRVFFAGINISFRDSEGKVLTDPEVKKKAIEDAGIGTVQMDQIVTDVMLLATEREKLADFLSGSGLV